MNGENKVVPRLAKSANINLKNADSDHVIVVDGEVFPFYVFEGGISSEITPDGLTALTLKIMIDGPVTLIGY